MNYDALIYDFVIQVHYHMCLSIKTDALYPSTNYTNPRMVAGNMQSLFETIGIIGI